MGNGQQNNKCDFWRVATKKDNMKRQRKEVVWKCFWWCCVSPHGDGTWVLFFSSHNSVSPGGRTARAVQERLLRVGQIDKTFLWCLENNSLRKPQHTPGTYPRPQPTVYEGIPFIWGFRDSWGMLQGYVGVFWEIHQNLRGKPPPQKATCSMLRHLACLRCGNSLPYIPKNPC